MVWGTNRIDRHTPSHEIGGFLSSASEFAFSLSFKLSLASQRTKAPHLTSLTCTLRYRNAPSSWIFYSERRKLSKVHNLSCIYHLDRFQLTLSSPTEILREHQRNINRAMRDIDRERTSLQNQEKKIVIEMKKLAKQGQMVIFLFFFFVAILLPSSLHRIRWLVACSTATARWFPIIIIASSFLLSSFLTDLLSLW